jgi:hypothetical protein
MGLHTSLAQAIEHMEDAQLIRSMELNTYVHKARQHLALRALDADATHVLWIDSDMTFPADAAVRLLAHNLPMVGINYCSRTIPPRFVSIKSVKKGERCVSMPGVSTGLEEVESIGFGMVLMKISVIEEALKGDGIAFNNVWLGNGDHMGEDVYFCQKVRKAHVRIFVDHDLSHECAHIGNFDYQTVHATDKLENTKLPEEHVAA